MSARCTLILRPLTAADEVPMRRMQAELAAEGFDLLPEGHTWAEVMGRAEREASGVDLEPGRVRADFLVAEVGRDVVGRASVRYALTDWLYHYGGHIGYAVAPAHRLKGYAGEMLRQSLPRLAAAGIDRALVTCDEGNVGSARVIEGAGGVLENVVDVGGGLLRRRYWIDVFTHA